MVANPSFDPHNLQESGHALVSASRGGSLSAIVQPAPNMPCNLTFPWLTLEH